MYLFKTSGETFVSVVSNQKHAFASMPTDWIPGELVLVSKNKADCSRDERQIQYVMRLDDIRLLRPGEAEAYWPGNEGRWKYLVICRDAKPVKQPFNLEEVLGEDSRAYGPVMTYKKITPEHEQVIERYLRGMGIL
jgi:hypothetical protein